MKELRLGKAILTALVRDRMQYPNRLIIDVLSMVARCGILLLLYSYVFRLKGNTIQNTSFIIVAWSMLFYFIFSVMRLRDIAFAIMRDVQSGTIEVLLSKPVTYLTYRMWWQLGHGLYSFAVIAVVGVAGLALMIGVPTTLALIALTPTIVGTFFLSILLSLLLYSGLGLLAFWIEDIHPLFWIVDKSVMILGGSYLPISLFPPLLAKAALYSPFGASQFMSHVVLPSWQSSWPLHLEIQLAWISVFLIANVLIFARARRIVAVNGG